MSEVIRLQEPCCVVELLVNKRAVSIQNVARVLSTGYGERGGRHHVELRRQI